MKEYLARLAARIPLQSRHKNRIAEILQTKPLLVGIGFLLFLILVNFMFISRESSTRILERPAELNFHQGRILNDRESTFYYGKERQLSKKATAMLETQAKLEARIAELEKRSSTANAPAALAEAPKESAQAGPEAQSRAQNTGIELYPAIGLTAGATVASGRKGRAGIRAGGPDLIAFPVKGDPKGEGLVLPSGSYVKAKILTGVDVPEGKTYPVLMVLDYSYVAPNDRKIDLSGCFMIAKAEGDLSTERVQMQASKMSCVSKGGKMFEREVNGFIADNRDGSFALEGRVNSKQGRVAAMAFMASVVDGVGKAVQAAQTTQSMSPLGGSSSVLTGDSTKYIAAGGASNAAGMVAQWYLQQAQALAPTVSVNSGRDVWIVMKDKVSLPEEFFKRERKANEGIYSYFSRVLD